MATVAGGILATMITVSALAAGPAALELDSKIALGAVRGRIDHLAIDLGRRRLFVAELGNDSVAVVDLKGRRTVQTLTGLSEPQGVGYVPSTDTLYVANGGDGTVRLFRGAALFPDGEIRLGADADDVRVDDSEGRVFVGYGKGGIAVIDAAARTRIADIRLSAHPEGFQLERSGRRIIVNVPDAREIAVLDLATRRQIARWSTDGLRANFPLALAASRGAVLDVFRRPARLAVIAERTGVFIATYPTCADADDLFVDAKHQRAYVICGQGFVDVLAKAAGGYHRIARLATAPGARTGLFVPQLDRLFVAVRRTSTEPAAVWVLRPQGGGATNRIDP